MVVFVLIILASIAMASSENSLIEPSCFGCICEAISQGKCVANIGCGEHGFCGPFRINWNYWNKAGRITLTNDRNPIGAWTRCVDDLQCAAQVVQEFMRRYAKDCNGDGLTDCNDFAHIHHHGRCSEFGSFNYQSTFTDCYYLRGNYSIHVSNAYSNRTGILLKNRPKTPKLIPIESDCFACICQAAFGNSCPVEATCEKGKCGAFKINLDYWIKAGNITLEGEHSNDIGAFQRCSSNTKCASRVVQGFMNKFAWDCDGDGAIDCNDYAHIHHLGRCEGKISITYEKEFQKCVILTEKRQIYVGNLE